MLEDHSDQPDLSRNTASNLDSVRDKANHRGLHRRISAADTKIRAITTLTPSPIHDMAQQTSNKGRTGFTENLTNLVLTSEPIICRTVRASSSGPIQIPNPDIELAQTSNSSPSETVPGDSSGISRLPVDIQSVTAQQTQNASDYTRYDERVLELTKSFAAIIPQNVLQVAAAVQAEVDQLVIQHEPGFLRQFRPSNSALKTVGLLVDSGPKNSLNDYASSNNYQGDITIAHNRSANIPDNENCAVWILGLPAQTTHTALLGSIRGVGQIYACVISPPTRQHQTAAAKIVFFERRQAERFTRVVLSGHLEVLGRRIRHIRWNKIKSACYPHSGNSRVIRLTGPGHLMDISFFEAFFKTRFTYELEQVLVVPCLVPNMASHEWRFGSLRCQSASAKLSVERELKGIFSVEWAHDPCM